MVFKWKEDHTSLVLQLLKDRECLWNFKCPKYRNKNARTNALKDIARQLNLPGVTVEDIKLKIKTIRTRYAAEQSKVQNSGRNDDIYVPKLSWYKQADSFLRGFCVPRKSAALTKINPIEQVVVEMNGEESLENNDEEETEDNADKEDGEETTEEDLQFASTEIQNPNMLRVEQSDRGIKRYNDFRGIPGRIDDCTIAKLRKLSDECKACSEDEFDFYCKSLAVQLRKMPVHRAIICQQQLQQVMTNERLYQLSIPESNTQSLSPALSSSMPSSASVAPRSSDNMP